MTRRPRQLTRSPWQLARCSWHLTHRKLAAFPLERPTSTYHSYLPKCLKPGQGVRARVGLAGKPGVGLKFGSGPKSWQPEGMEGKPGCSP